MYFAISFILLRIPPAAFIGTVRLENGMVKYLGDANSKIEIS